MSGAQDITLQLPDMCLVAEGKSIPVEMCVTSMCALTSAHTDPFLSASLKASGVGHPVVLRRELHSVGAIVSIKWCGITVTQKSQITNISSYAKLHLLFAEVGESVCRYVCFTLNFVLSKFCPRSALFSALCKIQTEYFPFRNVK